MKTRQPKLNQQQKLDIVALYVSKNCDISTISTQYCVSKSYIYNILHKYGVFVPTAKTYKQFNELEQLQIANLYGLNFRTEKIAREYNTTPAIICHILKRHSILMYPRAQKYFYNHNAFDDPLSDEAAYWLGFLMADGNVYGHHITLALKDIDENHLLKFATFLQSNKKIYHQIQVSKLVPTPTRTSSITISSKHIAKQIAKYGIVPNKTYIAKALNDIENNRHFWRGAIDGDGWVVKDKHNASLHVGLSGTKEICQQFLDFAQSTTVCVYKKRNHQCYTTKINGEQAYNAIKLLYTNHTISLTRKQTIADEFLVKFADKYKV